MPNNACNLQYGLVNCSEKECVGKHLKVSRRSGLPRLLDVGTLLLSGTRRALVHKLLRSPQECFEDFRKTPATNQDLGFPGFRTQGWLRSRTCEREGGKAKIPLNKIGCSPKRINFILVNRFLVSNASQMTLPSPHR